MVALDATNQLTQISRTASSWVSMPSSSETTQSAVIRPSAMAILMTQRLPPATDLYRDFWTSAYQAIDD